MRKRDYVMIVIGLLCLATISCNSVIDSITPVKVPNASLQYLNIELDGWMNLVEARELRDEIIIRHRNNQRDYLRTAEDDKMYFNDAMIIQENIKQTEEWQAMIIGDESHPFSILGIMAGLFPGLAVGGVFIKRPTDLTKQEVEVIVSKRLQEGK